MFTLRIKDLERGESDALFDMLDTDLNVTATLHTADFKIEEE